MPQARAHYVSLEKGAVKQALEDLKTNLPFDAFLQKYPQCQVQRDLLVIRSRDQGRGDKPVISFNTFILGEEDDHELNFTDELPRYEGSLKGQWIYEYAPQDKYGPASIEAFFFLTDPEQPALPEKYARMVQYTDCMIDTTTGIYGSGAHWGARWPVTTHPKMKASQKYMKRETGYSLSAFGNDSAKYDADRNAAIKKALFQTSTFTTLMKEAVEEALAKGGSFDDFEDLIAMHYSKKASLELKRNRMVVGGCSQDDRPRLHAQQIARLSAEAVNWETFLRAHLDIMNDNFMRMSDGSYAQQGRKTYIRELEVLDINLPDLLLGISLRISNPAGNHYYSSIGRLGRALAETTDPAGMEERMLAMIADNSLDTYNRLIIYHLFLNYNHHLQDQERKKSNITRLNTAVQALPAYWAQKAAVKPQPDKLSSGS